MLSNDILHVCVQRKRFLLCGNKMCCKHCRLTAKWCMQLVFATLSAGAIVLTCNVVLLGGNIGFFQSMCLLGYCIFPLDIAAIITIWVTNIIARWIVVLITLAWSSWASVPFIAGSVSPARKALAVYPLLLLYTCMAWLALIR